MITVIDYATLETVFPLMCLFIRLKGIYSFFLKYACREDFYFSYSIFK